MELNNYENNEIFVRFSIWNSRNTTFTKERQFRSIVPEYLPLRKTVLVTGVFEMFFGVMLLAKTCGWLRY